MFRDRHDAAQQLAERLRGRRMRNPVVLGIPRGGVVIGAALACELHADLDVILARKLRAPGNPELALGAVAESGEVYFNRELVDRRYRAHLQEEIETQLNEIARRRRLFRSDRGPEPMKGRSIILTDDGIATGSTMVAALQAVRGHEPHEVIMAAPVADPERLRSMRTLCDVIVCLIEDPFLRAVGQYYEDFSQVSDEEVVELLRSFAERRHENKLAAK
jgi:predicted phosphoribosyltransferase